MEKKKGLSRRDFLKKAAVGAGVAAAAVTAGKTCFTGKEAFAETGVPPIKVPDEIAISLAAPLPKVNFPMTGAQIFAKVCKAEGLAALFCCPGNYDIIHAIAFEGIPVWAGRHEGTMANAAEGFIRVSGEIAACSANRGGGFCNMIAAIGAAESACSPLLVVSDGSAIKTEDTGSGIQGMVGGYYQQGQTEKLKKYGKRIPAPSRVYEYAAYAFRQLKTGIPKPVHLDFPSEVYQAKFKSPDELTYYFDKSKYRTEAKTYPDPKAIKAAADLLKQAKRPIIVSSMGVFYHKGWEILRKLAEKTQIPVSESGPMKGQFPDDHPLSASAAPGCYESVDLVLLIGQYIMPTIGEFAFTPDAKYIRIDPDAADIGRDMPVEIGIVSDEKTALEALYNELPAMTHDAWIAEVAAARKKFEDENANYYKIGKSYTDCVHPAVIAQVLSDFIHRGKIPKDETTIASGGFGIARYTRRWLRAYRPAQIMNNAYRYANIGPDVGFSLGAAAAVQKGIGAQAPYQGHPVFCVTGDAGIGYQTMELETMAKYRLPVIVIVYNNNIWGTWSPDYRGTAIEQIHMFQENLRYDQVAVAMGGYGEYVTKQEDLLPALERCYDVAVTKKLPSIVNIQGKKEFWEAKKFPPGNLGMASPGVMSYYK